MTLFEEIENRALASAEPLAARMRPQSLHEFVGQSHILGTGQLLRRLIDADRLGSVIFYGPPGTGKTTLARLLAGETKRQYRQLSAVLHGVKDLRVVLEAARDCLASGGPGTLLFIDEIHRFNKAQQDALLADVEQGIVSLVGATTSNPFFAVNAALVSRSQVFQFEPLTISEIRRLLQRALDDEKRGLANYQVTIDDEALEFIAKTCDGDGRRALSALEIAVLSNGARADLTLPTIRQSTAHRTILYDREDSHYDCASALIKSIRGCDADAGIYWLARMLEGGEDIRFLCRRLVILASEDIGNADPQALPLAVACFQACEMIGLPECQFILAQTVTYLACAEKSNAATMAIGLARTDIREGRILPVPRHLRDAHFAAAKSEFGHGVDYEYSHHAEGGIAAQDYLGVEREYYLPVDRGFESQLVARLALIRAKLRGTDDSDSTV